MFYKLYAVKYYDYDKNKYVSKALENFFSIEFFCGKQKEIARRR